MNSLELSPPVFSILSSLIEQKIGLHYDLLDKDLLREKASSRAQEAGFDSLLDYYYYLKYDPAGAQELSQLIEALVVNETYFFREWPAIQALVNSFIKPWCDSGRRPRIWSAACSTGEEPLSLAMLLKDLGLLEKVEIVASDISPRVVARAKSGKFGRRSVRTVPEQRLLDQYIRAEREGFTVAGELIGAIKWENRNLLTEHREDRARPFDIILCRNVLIYFSDSTVQSVLGHLSTSLAGDGVLIVGVSESLLRYGSGFKGEEHGGSFVYRKSLSS